ncbi:MAG: 5-oxoprolinase subunit PxpA [Clostridiales bacterium]|nr:5-oxoprolinase subunit PxpA [Clostridiales bacterium]
MKIDLNCDLGESFGVYALGNDEMIMDYVTSVNIACGCHAGDPEIMEKTVELAIKKGVSIGAHPGYPDLQGFGRRDMAMSKEALRASMIYQISALKGFVEIKGGKLQHVKPHGALYNLAAKDYEVARVIAQAIYDIDPSIIFMGLADSEMIRAGNDVGLKVAREVFADRRYTKDKNLVPRNLKGAVIEDVSDSINQCLSIISKHELIDYEGNKLILEGDSICIHGDNAHGIELVSRLRETLKNQSIKIQSLEV